jgi:hypothetical protein
MSGPSVVRGLAESLAGRLLGHAEYGRNLSPRPPVRASPGHLLGKCQVDGGHSVKCLSDTAKVSPVGVWRCERLRVESVEPGFGVGDGLLKLGAGSWHRIHLR